MKRLKKVTLIILLLVGFSAFAQSTPPNPNPPPPGLPIDGFIWLGILIAIGYGIYAYPERSRRVFTRRNDEVISSNLNTCPEHSRSASPERSRRVIARRDDEAISQSDTKFNNPKK